MYHEDIKGTYEPRLVAIFERLNKEIFNDQLPMPDAICYDYRRVGSKKSYGRGGQIYYRFLDGHVWYIVVRGKQKGNAKHEELTMLHEMVHLSLVVQFFNSDLPDTNYRVKDFVTDKSASFILECARVARKFGITFSDLASWDTSIPDQETHITSNTYNEIQDAKSLLASLS